MCLTVGKETKRFFPKSSREDMSKGFFQKMGAVRKVQCYCCLQHVADGDKLIEVSVVSTEMHLSLKPRIYFMRKDSNMWKALFRFKSFLGAVLSRAFENRNYKVFELTECINFQQFFKELLSNEVHC